MYSFITVCAVYGHKDGASAIPSLLKSSRSLPGSGALLLSPQEPANLPSEIKWQKILPMNYKQYSLFLIFCLKNFIKNDFCLIVQDDGWVLNENNWEDKFLDYDYIGAPCHAAVYGDKLLTGFSWADNNQVTVIQNGGFSLRSMKYLSAPSDYGVMYHFSNTDVIHNEDIQLTGIYRKTLEEKGIKFAANKIAMNFSVEFLGDGFHNDIDLSKVFGIHGQIRKLTGEKKIQYTISRKRAEEIFMEKEIIKLFFNLGYEVYFAPDDGRIS